ncbi:nuclear transport factor 2 family protein [Corallococcus sp. RDP092CA]|uniref:nuclear transport factor 2 family protein n=1 Tax=Corallococcus sp. RDP092CA TaxID=3109369 RepID=UPI0035AE47EA
MSRLEALAVREVIERFHDAVNHRDFAAIEPLFAADGVWVVAPPFDRHIEGAANIASGVAESVGKLELLIQTCSPIIVDLTDETHATVRTSMQEVGRFKGGGSMRVAGTYFDTLHKDGGVWRFTHRVFRPRYADAPPLTGQLFDTRESP